MNLNHFASDSYHLHKILEHATAMNAGNGFLLDREDKTNFLAFIQRAIEKNAELGEQIDD